MSYIEYNDLLVKCQNDGLFRVFTFDIVGSRQMEEQEAIKAHENAIILIERLYQDLNYLQDELCEQILIDDLGFKTPLDGENMPNDWQIPYDWFMIGDTVGLTIYNGTVSPQVVNKLFDLNKKELKIDTEFHKYDVVYETNKYEEGHDKYFRGYAIHMSANMHKKDNELLRWKVNRLKSTMLFNEEAMNRYMELARKKHQSAVEKATSRLNASGIETTREKVLSLSNVR